jgi:hypothetical protein
VMYDCALHCPPPYKVEALTGWTNISMCYSFAFAFFVTV